MSGEAEPAGTAADAGRPAGTPPETVLVAVAGVAEAEGLLLGAAGAALRRLYALHLLMPADVAAILPAPVRAAADGLPVTTVAIPPERRALWRDLVDLPYRRAAADAAADAAVPPSARPLDRLRALWPPHRAVRRRAEAERQERRRAAKDLRNAWKSRLDEMRGLAPLPALLEAQQGADALFAVMPSTLVDDFCNEVLLACAAGDLPLALVLEDAPPVPAGGAVLAARPAVVVTPAGLATPPGDLARLPADRRFSLEAPLGDGLAELCRAAVEPLGRKKRLTRVNRQRGSISHAYAANLVIGAYCGLKTPPEIPGYWMHGWLPPFHNRHFAIVAQHKAMEREDMEARRARIAAEKATHTQFVAREDQAAFLRSCGYAHVHAIGLPFAYLPEVAVARRPGRLLVMPPHGRGGHGPGDPLAEAYAAYIAERRDRFSSVALVVTAGDHALGEWVDPFRARGFEIVVGASGSDEQTLLRLKTLLSEAEFVTTNGFGSHIAYAAACGARVSVAGPFAEWPPGSLARAFEVRTYPEILELQSWLASEEAIRAELPFLFTPPEEAADLTAWGEHQIGRDIRKAPAEIRSLFDIGT